MTGTAFVRTHTSVEAMRFDGTCESALAIAAKFPRRIAMAVEHDDVLLAVVAGELVTVPVGAWVISRLGYGDIDICRDEHFAALHRPCS